MKPIQTTFFAWAVVGLALTSCMPETPNGGPETGSAFHFQSPQAHQQLLSEVSDFNDEEFLRWEAAQGQQSFAGAYFNLIEQLGNAKSQEELLALASQHPDLIYLEGDELLPMADFTGVGRLADRTGMYTVGNAAYRSHKGYLFQTHRSMADQLLHLQVQGGNVDGLSEAITTLAEPQSTRAIQEEWLPCNSSTIAYSQIGNGQAGNQGRRVSMQLYSHLRDSNLPGYKEHVIRVRTEAQYRFWGIWLNGPTTIYLENNAGNIITIKDAISVYDPVNNTTINKVATYMNQDYSFANYTRTGVGFERYFRIRLVKDLWLPNFYNPEIHWNSRRIQVRTTGTNGQHAHLNCD